MTLSPTFYINIFVLKEQKTQKVLPLQHHLIDERSADIYSAQINYDRQTYFPFTRIRSNAAAADAPSEPS